MFKNKSFLSSGSNIFIFETNFLRNFGRGHYEKNLFEIILNLDLWFRRYLFKLLVLFLAFCSFVQNHFVQSFVVALLATFE